MVDLVGCTVELTGLASEAGQAHNGRLGLVRGFDERSGRLLVALAEHDDQLQTTLRVKPENVMQVPAAKTPATPKTEPTSRRRKGKARASDYEFGQFDSHGRWVSNVELAESRAGLLGLMSDTIADSLSRGHTPSVDEVGKALIPFMVFLGLYVLMFFLAFFMFGQQ